jgi:GAF domain-containing protein
VLSVPVRLADQPVGTLTVYASQPRAWSPAEVQALGALALVTAELVHTAVELANREVEVAQLRQGLASRIWIEQAKGMLAATQGVTLDQAFGELRRRAREAEQALEAARTGLARRQAALDRAQDDLDVRERVADQRDHLADERDRAADERNHLADTRDRAADARDRTADQRDRAADQRHQATDNPE